ncbi:hypothetical protein H5410_038305 [Solanum commersonii]|uniref:Uncharacterized protein n=1 Tax=Solanum commersonii TaxID=4109 RepID=A0A9J5Y9P6_SOLCO|nr:hypothetical protein H5410_038305 [Solanum commersonii]
MYVTSLIWGCNLEKKSAHRHRERRERNLQEEFKAIEFTFFLLDKEVADAPVPELVESHNSKYGSTKCEQQQDSI